MVTYSIYNEPRIIYDTDSGFRGKFHLSENYETRLYLGCKAIIPTHLEDGSVFYTDLSSVPKPLRSFYDRVSFGIRPPVIHDYLCITKGVIQTRELGKVTLNSNAVHYLFYENMIQSGIPKLTAMNAYAAVALFGPRWSYAKSNTLKQLRNVA